MNKLLLVFLLFSMTSCQHNYDDDDDYYSIVPLTNNPDITREKNDILPQMGY